MATVEVLVNKGNSVVGLIVSTLLIISLQVAALLPLVATPLELLMVKISVLYPTNVLYIVSYFIFPLIYYIAASLLLNPKRIISPLFAQIGTISIITILLTYKIATSQPQTVEQLLTLIQSFVLTIAFWAIFLGEMGLVQLFLVRWVVGLSFDSVDRASFLVEGKSAKDVIALFSNSFIKMHQFDKPFQRSDVWVIRRFDSRTKSSLIIVVGEQPGDSQNCIIAMIAYRKGMYVIKKDKVASDTLEEFYGNIMGKLRKIDPKIKDIRISEEKLNDDISMVAYEEAREITVSKLGVVSEKVRDIPLYYRILIAGTILALITLVFMQIENYGSFVELIAAVIIALALEIGLPLREELRNQLSRRKNES